MMRPAPQPGKPPTSLPVRVPSLGWNDLGFRNGNEIDTPNLDSVRRTLLCCPLTVRLPGATC